MKNNYEKPVIYFESFALSQSIAANCLFISASKEQDTPIYDPELGIQVYVMGPDGAVCNVGPDGDSICYDVPNWDTTVFSS